MFDPEQYIKQRTAAVEKALETILPDPETRPAILHEAMRHAVFPAGKRLRPVLCLAAAEAVGTPFETAVIPAAAVEILHNYTLVHDDLPCMDDDETRRGRPSCHSAFGEANAVLAGDALLALAFSALARQETDPGTVVALVRELGDAAGSSGVTGGQTEDLAYSAGVAPDLETIQYIHNCKTAVLFRCAVRMGGICGKADESSMNGLSSYGTALGLAFQIADDLADVEKNETSYLQVCPRDQAAQRASEFISRAVEAVADLQSPGRDALEHIARLCSVK